MVNILTLTNSLFFFFFNLFAPAWFAVFIREIGGFQETRNGIVTSPARLIGSSLSAWAIYGTNQKWGLNTTNTLVPPLATCREKSSSLTRKKWKWNTPGNKHRHFGFKRTWLHWDFNRQVLVHMMDWRFRGNI